MEDIKLRNGHKFFNRKLRTLIFFITTKCQLKCKHCFYSSELNNPEVNELTLKEIEKIADKIPSLEYVQISGGEPFLRNDLIEVMEIFFKRGIKKIMIPSNGYLTKKIVSQAKIMKQKGFYFSIMISIDGFKDIHNKIRGTDCFDKAMHTFDELNKLGIETGFNVSLSKLNYDSYIDLIKFLKTKTENIDPILVRAKPGVMLSAEEFKKIRPELEKLSFRNLTPFYKQRRKLLNDIYYDILRGKRLPFKCLAGETVAVLEPDGSVRTCEIRKKLGNVRNYNYDIKKILKLDKMSKRCKNCIHPCFIGPSLSYSPKWMLKNIIYQYA